MKLLVINDYGIHGGGTENRVRLLLEEFLRRNACESVHVIQAHGPGGVAGYPDRRMRVHAVSGGMRTVYRLARTLIRQEGISLVQAHNMLSLTPAGVEAARQMRIPVVWYAHDYWPICAYRSFIDPYRARTRELCQRTDVKRCLKCCGIRTLLRLARLRLLLKGVTRAVASCAFVQAMFEKHGVLKDKWTIIPPWLDTGIFCADPAAVRQRTIVFAGSMLDYKGAWVLAEAFVRVRRALPDVRLIFAGGEQEAGPSRERIEKIISDLPVRAGVEFLGMLDAVSLSRLYRTAGMFVFPSVCMESFGLAWAEAMACGCPVVASRVGSLPDFLEGKAVLVRPKDSHALADAIIGLFNDQDLSLRLSREGTEYAASFGVKRAADEVIRLYTACLAGGVSCASA